MNSILAFTDGSSRGNPGPGGWGAVIVSSDGVIERGGGEEKTTNNRMELSAALAAIEEISVFRQPAKIYSDSQYVINGVTKWLAGWKNRNWQTSTKAPVLNRDLWQAIDRALLKASAIEWIHVEGHVGVPGNERADEIATAMADRARPALYKGSLIDYPVNIFDFSVSPEKKEKKEGRSRNTGKAYSYVSSVDGVINIHKTWAECEARVKGKKARFRKALSPEDEEHITNVFRNK